MAASCKAAWEGGEIEDPGALPFLVAFPMIWAMAAVLVARLGGWARLGREYPAQPQNGGRRFRFQSGRMRFWTGYGSCLMIGSDPLGLHLAVLFIFRPGHPPLFIPWSEVSVCEDRVPTRRGVALSFIRAPEIPLILNTKLMSELAQASSGGFDFTHPA
jgi:hypothetical protein